VRFQATEIHPKIRLLAMVPVPRRVAATRADIDQFLDMPSSTHIIRVCAEQNIVKVNPPESAKCRQLLKREKYELWLDVSEQGFEKRRVPALPGGPIRWFGCEQRRSHSNFVAAKPPGRKISSNGMGIGGMSVYYTSLAVAILLGIAGQIALKSAANGSETVVAQFLNPLTIIGLGVYVLAALCYILAIKQIPVSIAFPSVAASYAVVAVVAHVLWNEPFGWPQLAGIVLIGGGVLLIQQY
jgi:small multidrug resistance pump